MNHSKPTPRRGKPATLIHASTAAIFGSALLATGVAHAEQPMPPCHPNPQAAEDVNTIRMRGDVQNLPDILRDALQRLAGRPHSQLPLQVYAEADKPSQLFQYYLLTTHGFEANPFTATFAGINDTAMFTATGFDCGLSTLGAVRIALEPKPGLPTDPSSVRAFIDVFTDISGLFVINNESGWYEGWMIHDLTVPRVAPSRADGHARFGTLTAADAKLLSYEGTGHNVPGKIFTMDGREVRFPSSHDVFPKIQSNVVPIQLSMGAYNCLQQSDCHAYWEFNYQTNWIHPLYELPFTGGIPGTFEAGKVGALSSVIPGPGPAGPPNDAIHYGDNPNTKGVIQGSGPRDTDKFDADDESQREFRQRFIPSGLANEIYLDTYERLASFEPGVKFPKRLFDAYAAEVKRVDSNGDGVISAAEGDVDTGSDGYPNNDRLFLSATQFDRFAVTREINDGILAPRFAPSQRAWVLQGRLVPVRPAVAASAGRDGDDR